MPYIYHPSRIIYYSSTHFVLFHHHYYSLLIITVYFFLFFFLLPHTSLLMADANAMYHPSFIIYYSSTHYLFTYYFLINRFFFPPWLVDANFIFILVFTSSYFCFILRMRHGLFILSHFIYMCCLYSTHFHHSCSSHIVFVNTFYLVFYFYF